MNTKQQKIVMAVAGVACAAVWGPQVLGRFGGGATSSQVDLGPSPEEMAAMTAGLVDGGAAPGAPGGTGASPGGATRPGASNTRLAAGLGARATGDSREGLGELLASLETFGAAGKARSLDDLATEWARARGRTGADPAPASSSSTTDSAPLVPRDEEGLSAYLAANPFRGTLVFEDDAVALFGPNALRVGDELLGGEAVVARIEGQRVTVSVRGIPREIALPPLRASQASSEAGDASRGAAAPARSGSASSSGSASAVPESQQDLQPTVMAPTPGGAN